MIKLNILEEKDNELFNRKEIKATAEAEITPSREEVMKALAEKFSIPEENIKIKGIHGKFGSKTFSIEANLYVSAEEKEQIEIKKKKEGAGKIEEKGEPVEEAKETPEKPAEEQPPEEPKPEEETKEEIIQDIEKSNVPEEIAVKEEALDEKEQEEEPVKEEAKAEE